MVGFLYCRSGVAAPGRFSFCVRIGHNQIRKRLRIWVIPLSVASPGRICTLQDVQGDHLANLCNVGIGGEFQLDLAEAGEPDLQLAVQIQDTGGLDGVGLNFAVGQGSEVLFLAGDALNIDCNDALVGEDNTVTDGLIGADDLLAGDKHGGDGGSKDVVVDGLELQKISVFEVEHVV